VQFFLNLVDHFGYPGLFIVMVLGNLGLPVGTEVVVPVAGALAATGHLSSWWLAALVATAGELVGSAILYAIGYYGGRPFVARWGKYVKLDENKLDRFHGFYERYGNVVVLICRFIPFVRGVAALPAGISRMQKRFFFLYTLIGSSIFCFGLAYLGHAFGRHIDEITPRIHNFSIGFVIGLVLVIGGYVAYRLLRKPSGEAA
jgi:membrane protein DedA with SNARE-associated domain